MFCIKFAVFFCRFKKFSNEIKTIQNDNLYSSYLNLRRGGMDDVIASFFNSNSTVTAAATTLTIATTTATASLWVDTHHTQ